MDFVIITQYSTYDKETISYIKHTLLIINIIKDVFYK